MSNNNDRLKLLRKNSRAQVTLGVRKHGPISRVHLAKITGLSMTCVCGIVDELVEEGMLIETGTQAGNRGRPMALVNINPDGAPAVGIWLSPEVIEIAVASPTAEILSRRTISLKRDDRPEAIIETIVQGVVRCVTSAKKQVKLLRGVGVSLAGLVDPMLGVLDDLTNRTGWEGVPIVRLLESKLGVPVYTDNDVRAAALTFQWFDDQATEGGTLYITVGDGIGATFINNQELLRGSHDAAGLLGHIKIDLNGPPCGCGDRGCLEAMASDIAFIHSVWPELSKRSTEMTATERVELVRRGLNMAFNGDPNANYALVSVTKYLGIGLANAICLYDPKTVFIGGTLIDCAGDTVIDLIRREVMQHIWVRSRGVEIKSLFNYQEFLLQGSIGLVLLKPYRTLHEANMSARTIQKIRR